MLASLCPMTIWSWSTASVRIGQRVERYGESPRADHNRSVPRSVPAGTRRVRAKDAVETHRARGVSRRGVVALHQMIVRPVLSPQNSAEVPLMFRRLLIALTLLVMSSPALGVNPETEIAGATGKWFTGELIQQTGLNCATAILGEPYTEVMVSGYSSYGGAPNGGLPRVGQGYYTSLLLAVPGNPCGSGVSAVATEVILPPGTQVDTSRPIRCFGQPQGAGTFIELTGGTWSHLGSSGAYCPSQVSPAIYTQGAVSVGFRPIVNGQFFQVFLPVISSTQLVGMGNFNDRFMWTTNATGVYANPALSSVWANVFAASNVGQGPFVYFARQPAAIPYWKATASSSPDLRNRVELFANFYTAGLAGTVSYTMTRTDTNTQVWSSTQDGAGFNGVVPVGLDLVQITATGDAAGPNGGYSPVAFDPPGTPGNPAGEWNVPMLVTWTFTPNVGLRAGRVPRRRTCRSPGRPRSPRCRVRTPTVTGSRIQRTGARPSKERSPTAVCRDR